MNTPIDIFFGLICVCFFLFVCCFVYTSFQLSLLIFSCGWAKLHYVSIYMYMYIFMLCCFINDSSHFYHLYTVWVARLFHHKTVNIERDKNFAKINMGFDRGTNVKIGNAIICFPGLNCFACSWQNIQNHFSSIKRNNKFYSNLRVEHYSADLSLNTSFYLPWIWKTEIIIKQKQTKNRNALKQSHQFPYFH